MDRDWQLNKSSSECSRYLLDDEANCDVSFKVGVNQEVIKAHRFILGSRSPVFAKMFKVAFGESEKEPIISDVSPAAFRTLLRYCYYECLDIDGKAALSVLYAAIKYMLPILERAARKTLLETLDSSKIWDACKYATEVSDDELYAGCITHLKENLNEANLLQVIKYAVTTGHQELEAFCGKHLSEKLSSSNISDVTRYVFSIQYKELHAICKSYIKEHLSGSNIWEVYKYGLTEGDTEVHQYCRDYFKSDVTIVSEALKSKEFSNILYDILIDLLKINDKVDKTMNGEYLPGISISEIELFKACDAWAEAECLRWHLDPGGANKRTVLGECLSLIRFPAMLPKDLITTVYPTGILKHAEIVNLGRHIDREPGTEYKVDFPSKERQFVVTCSRSNFSGGPSTVHVDSEVRVLLSRVWISYAGSFRLTVKAEKSPMIWSMLLDTKSENLVHEVRSNDCVLQYIDIEPHYVLEPGTRYIITAECIKGGGYKNKLPNVEYTRIQGKVDRYKEVKLTHGSNSIQHIYAVTLSLV